jgi:hypothetical protein
MASSMGVMQIEGRGEMLAQKEERRKVVSDGWCLTTSVFFAVSCTIASALVRKVLGYTAYRVEV